MFIFPTIKSQLLYHINIISLVYDINGSTIHIKITNYLCSFSFSMSDVNKYKKKTTTTAILMYCYFNILNFDHGLNYLLEFYVDNL